MATMACGGSPGDSWPTFRGPHRTAAAPDKGLLKAWPKEGPKLVWQTAGAGRGYSSLAIAGGRIYTLGDAPSTASDEDEYLVCFDQADGKQLWKAKTGLPWKEGKPNWQSSRSTPTVDGDRVYVVTPHGVLVCCDTNGKEVWRKDLPKEFEGKKADGWGYSESVLVDGDHLVCTPGGPAHTLVALDKLTGETRWTASRPEDRGAGHSSVVVTNIGDTRVYVQSTGSGPMGVRASDGKLLWTFDIEHTTAVIPTPIVRDDLVFFVAGYGRGGALLKQVPGAAGEVAMEVVYPLNKELGNKHGGVVLVGDYLYGDSEDRGIPYCAELLTGEVKWKSRGAGRDSASMVAADGHIYVHYADGTMALVKASPEAFEEVGHFQVPGSGDRPSWSHPVILDGKLYIREGDVIACYDVRQEK
ncbi:MAG TPA: PQQ-binding-like beta-propeller repeat protein [Pirellulales bacterium]|nr:PQQ-binding-like beta-propeller repeat protein [Pirellulales bacterium]